ncbi:DUF883 domain-containing protein [Psychromarinibacter sp. C21-152]|uniref:DUF883 domain-containing protein n=1 Tax=Psychromarinibacter sediminicola TaxID=3033385 RepID=A0AAE3NUI4_9RHOB|nr:DUF883 domain-containing protein [Psychromarinibacter sediminicola]MDF0600842.1 DUF883 domain-containing protein [Psychromarinibacter sediminicola]
MANTTTNGPQASPVKTSDIDELKAQIETLKADMSSLTGTVRDMGRTRAEALRGAASEQANAWRGQGEEAVRRARAKGQEAYGSAEASIRENPATAVGIAAGVGFLTGLILSRK